MTAIDLDAVERTIANAIDHTHDCMHARVVSSMDCTCSHDFAQEFLKQLAAAIRAARERIAGLEAGAVFAQSRFEDSHNAFFSVFDALRETRPECFGSPEPSAIDRCLCAIKKLAQSERDLIRIRAGMKALEHEIYTHDLLTLHDSPDGSRILLMHGDEVYSETANVEELLEVARVGIAH